MDEQDYFQKNRQTAPDPLDLSNANIVPPVDFDDFAGGHINTRVISDSETQETAKPGILMKIARWIGYIVIFATPLFFLPFSFDVLEFNKQYLIVIGACIGAVLFLIETIRRGTLFYVRNRLALPVFIFIIGGIVAVISSVYWYGSLFGIGEGKAFSFVSIVSIIILGFVTLAAGGGKKNILVISQISVMLMLLFGFLQTMGIFVFRMLGNNFIVPNTVGSFDSIGLIGAVFLPIFLAKESFDGKIWRWLETAVKVLGLVLALFILIVVGSIGLWLAAFLSLAVFVLINRSNWVADRIRLLVAPVVIIALGIALLMINPAIPKLKSRISLSVVPSIGESYRVAWKSLISRPFGYGQENFGIAFNKFRLASGSTRPNDSATEFSTIIANSGIISAIAFILIVIYFFRELFRRRIGAGAESAGVLSAAAGLILGFFLLPFNITSVFALIIIISLATYSNEIFEAHFEHNSKKSLLVSLVFIAGVVLSLLTGYRLTKNYIADAAFLDAQIANTDKDSNELFAKSIQYNKRDIRPMMSLSLNLIIQLARETRTGAPSDETPEHFQTRIQNQLNTALGIAKKATDTSPYDYRTWLNRAYILENLIGVVGNAGDESLKMYKEAIIRDPQNPIIYERVGEVYLSLADFNGNTFKNTPKGSAADELKKTISDDLSNAETNFKKALSLNSRYGQPAYNLAVVYNKQGRVNDVIKQFEILRGQNPKDPTITFQLGFLYYYAGRKNDAFNSFLSAVALAPNYSNARWYLSLLYEERGDKTKAISELQEILKLNPDNNLVKNRLSLLMSGVSTVKPNGALNQEPLD
ncbi:MAG: TPR Domain containing protein [Parcubacteria group bacterium Licking1014_17]|nr:MAG: TPR Domain containing protein [Parcubacteria group bacterium Licking1014_17]